jgi:broad specificity phosphatase PhoE
MAKLDQYGDRRCTLEGAELLVRIYRSAYTRRAAELSNGDMAAIPPAMIRTKKEIDEAQKLIESAKKKGASTWESVKDRVQAALDRLTSSYREAILH